MAYGTNAPWGLKAVKSLNGSTWNGQTNQYYIQSGYASNIFRGDLVYMEGGFIRNLADLPGELGTQDCIGAFQGVTFTVPTSVNPIAPADPKSYWPAGTTLSNELYCICDIIDDPATIFNVQGDGFAFLWTSQGKNADVAYSYVSPSTTNPSGNFNQGVSTLVLTGSTIGVDAVSTFKILRFVPVDGNVPDPGGIGIQYANFEVLIQNHAYRTMPAGM